MAADGGSWIERNAEGSGGFWRKLTKVWWAVGVLKNIDQEDQRERWEEQQVRSEGGEWSEKNGQVVAR
jgi:hypothetical protein